MRSVSLALVAASLAVPGLAIPCGSFIASVSKTVTWFGGFNLPPPELSNTRDEYPDTIYRVLKGKEEFSSLVRILDKFPDVRSVLDSDKLLTFFAPTNEALEHHAQFSAFGDDHKEKIVTATLNYHIVPGVLESRLFGQNSTIATHLIADDGTFDHSRRRIKVETSIFPLWKTTLNNYVTVTEGDIHAKNGVIHAIDHPLYLPLDIMDLIYMLPEQFSISAAALLKTNLQNHYEFNSHFKKDGDKDHHNDRHGRGTPLSTLFVPSNDAWNKLPKDLRFYLFSPMGERTLRKLLAWHTLPETVVFSEWVRSNHKHDDDKKKKKHASSLEDPDLSFEWDHHFRTLIEGQTLPVHVKKTKSKLPGSETYDVTVQAHGLYADSFDNPAQNGAVHVVPQVLSPRSLEGVDEARNAKDWEEWREWLTDWSYEHNERDL